MVKNECAASLIFFSSTPLNAEENKALDPQEVETLRLSMTAWRKSTLNVDMGEQ